MKRIRVLCAMRDLRVAESLRRRLCERCLFFTAQDGVTALEIAAHEPPDVLIVDAVLPGMDGVGLMERLRGMLGERMPQVIGGSVRGFSDEAFLRLGAQHTAMVPWDEAQLCGLLEQIVCRMETRIDWAHAGHGACRAQALLRDMGMNDRLHGFTYLAWAAALAGMGEDRLYNVREKLYVPVAERFHTTPGSVERLIRHAVERTADTLGAQGIYTFFGNTIDPMRGKPTNAQMIGMLGERIRIG